MAVPRKRLIWKLGFIITALLAAGLVDAHGIAAQAAGQAAGPTNGRLLYPYFPVKLKEITGEADELDVSMSGVAEFSPSGDAIAGNSTTCTGDTCVARIKIVRSDGTVTIPPFQAEEINSITWSPDGTKLAVSEGSDFNDVDIWVVPVNGDAAYVIRESTAQFRVEDGHIAWRPNAESVAFVGTPLEEDGSSLSIETDQLYLVSTTGSGVTTKYNQTPPDCEFPSCRIVAYSDPAWSPDGSKIAAFVTDSNENFETDVRTEDEYLATITPGQAPGGTSVKSLLHLVNPDSWQGRTGNRPVWSADGAEILYGSYSTDEGPQAANILTLAGGAQTPVTDSAYSDWQPCPTGTCATFGDPEQADLSLTVAGYAAKTKQGKEDGIVAKITNAGPAAAVNAKITVATPKGMFYTKVSPAAGWTCDQHRATSVSCSVASLAAGASAQLSVGLFAVKTTPKAKLVARATSDTGDAHQSNNVVLDTKKILEPSTTKPKGGALNPPTVGRPVGTPSPLARGPFKNFNWSKWYSVDSSNRFYYKVTSLTCQRTGGVDDTGYVTGTLWIWESGKSGTTHYDIGAAVKSDPDVGFSATMRNGNWKSAEFADDAKNYTDGRTFAWSLGGNYDYYKMLGKWHWHRPGATKRDKHIQTELFTKC